MTHAEAKELRDRLGARHYPPVFFAIVRDGEGFAVARKELQHDERGATARVVEIIRDKESQ